MRTSGLFVGRQEEIRQMGEVADSARTGHGGVLVLRGEAGIGKTTLLRHFMRTPGFQVVNASGSQFDADLPFAALQQVCAPVLDHVDHLPSPHRKALEVAFGLTTGVAEVFRVGPAALGLLSAAARERPLLCIIDDAHWLDTASVKALTFIARRVAAEPIAMMVAVESPSSPNRLPSLTVQGLSDADARTLLSGRDAPFDENGILAEARGNPLALLELPCDTTDDGPVADRIERAFRARLSDVDVPARQLLTVASADPTGDPGLLWPAALRLGINLSTAGAAATATGLVEIATQVRFRHPLARSAVYRAATEEERRTAHRVLAEVSDPVLDLDRRAWHRAMAGTGPDDDVAEELERSATRAQARGGVVAAASLIERSAALSVNPAKRIERTLTATQAQLAIGATETAARLLSTVDSDGLDELQQTQADLLRGRIGLARANDDSGPMFMLRAAQRLAALYPAQSRDCFLDAIEMSLTTGRSGGVLEMLLAAARTAKPAPRSPDLLDALTALTTTGHQAAVPLMRAALNDDAVWTQRPALAIMLAAELLEPQTHEMIFSWLVRAGRSSGSPLMLRLGLAQMASSAALRGDFGHAMACIAEEEAIGDATDGPDFLYPRLHLVAMRGRREEGAEEFGKAMAAATARGNRHLVTNVHWASAVLHNSVGDHRTALTAARQTIARDDLFITGIALPELVEAAMRCGEPDTAMPALESLTERAQASGSPTGLGMAAFSRGLVTGAEEDYRSAIGHLADSPMIPYRTRAHLLYGEWLRGEGRAAESRQQLGTAHELASFAGLEGYAQRAAAQLRELGSPVGRSPGHVYDQLTVQEVCIARLMAGGVTTEEIATRLFITPRTVDAHLAAILDKLGVTSVQALVV